MYGAEKYAEWLDHGNKVLHICFSRTPFFYEKSPARLYASYMHMVSLPNFQKAVRQERKLATGGGETLTLVGLIVTHDGCDSQVRIHADTPQWQSLPYSRWQTTTCSPASLRIKLDILSGLTITCTTCIPCRDTIERCYHVEVKWGAQKCLISFQGESMACVAGIGSLIDRTVECRITRPAVN